MKVALLVPPGTAKYNFSEKIAEKYSIPLIKLKDLLLNEVNSGSDLGLDIQKQVDNSKPISNDNIISIMTKCFETSYEDGFLLDGLPCNNIQSQALHKILKKKKQKLQNVIFLQLEYDRLMEFLTGQLTCRSCEANFNIYFNPPYLHNICDECGGKLYKRVDDREETISRRIREFENYLISLQKYYNEDILKVVKSDVDEKKMFNIIDETFENIKQS